MSYQLPNQWHDDEDGAGSFIMAYDGHVVLSERTFDGDDSMLIDRIDKNGNITRLVSITESGSISSSTPVVIDLSAALPPYRIKVIPGGGNTSLVEVSSTPGAASSPGTANWENWPAGTVSAATSDIQYGRLTAVRISRISGTSTDAYEVLA